MSAKNSLQFSIIFFSAAENLSNLFVGGKRNKAILWNFVTYGRMFELSVGAELTLYWRQGLSKYVFRHDK